MRRAAGENAGQDVVVGAMQPQVPAEVEPLLRKLEVIPLKVVGGGTAIDVDALIPAPSFGLYHRWSGL